MRRIRKMKIRTKMIGTYICACVIPLIFVSIIIYKVAARNLEESAMEFTSVFSSQIVKNIDNFIEEYDGITKSVLVDEDVIYDMKTSSDDDVITLMNRQLYLRKNMNRIMALQPEIKNIYFLTADDYLFQFSSAAGSISQDILLEQEWVKKIEDSGEVLMITAVHDMAYYEMNQDGIVFTVSRKLYDNRGAYAGRIFIDLDSSSLVELSEGFLWARNSYNIKINVSDAWEDILYDSDIASGRTTWEELRQSGDVLLYEKNPDEYIIMSNETKRCGLTVNAVIPKSSLLLKIDHVSYVTVLAVIACVIVVLVMSVFFSHSITWPILRLQTHMKQIGEGEYRIVEQFHGEDEIGILIDSYNQMVMQIKRLIEEVYVAEIKQKNAKIMALQTQINPHMLYNTLESIRMKALMSDQDEIAEMVKILARMFRMALGAQTGQHRIRDEIDYAVNYIKLQNLRFPDMYFLEVEVDERIQDAHIVALVFQPIIENCIEHGARDQKTGLHMVLKGEMTEKQDILLTISDDGKGMPRTRAVNINKVLMNAELDKLHLEENQQKGRVSIGLKNIAERIKLYYGDTYYVLIDTENESGTVVKIRIPGRWDDVEELSGEEHVPSIGG